MIFHILLFLVCCALFYFSGRWIINGLMRVAKFLEWREFVVAFFVMATAGTLPNLFVGISSALRGIPQLSFGDVAGNNLIGLTLSTAIAAMLSKKGTVAKSKTVQSTLIFTFAAALLPLVLSFDGNLTRIDATILIVTFVGYVVWLFSKEERFTKTYEKRGRKPADAVKKFRIDMVKLGLGLIILIAASQGVVISANYFAATLGLSLVLIGVLITGPGSALPEIYFDAVSAKKGDSWLTMGDSMGAIILPATLVLGIVSMICPMQNLDFSTFAVARIFLIIAAILFLFFARSKEMINKNEALILLCVYIVFLIVEVFFKNIILHLNTYLPIS